MSNDQETQSEYAGHLTMADGTHVPLSKEEAEALLQKADEEKEARANAMPGEREPDDNIEGFYRSVRQGWDEREIIAEKEREARQQAELIKRMKAA